MSRIIIPGKHNLTGNQYDDFGMPEGPAVGNPMRRAVLYCAKKFREGRAKLRHMGFGGAIGLIPELDYYVLCERFPDLRSPDPEIQTKAWKDLLNGPLGEEYNLSRKRRGPQCRSITAR